MYVNQHSQFAARKNIAAFDSSLFCYKQHFAVKYQAVYGQKFLLSFFYVKSLLQRQHYTDIAEEASLNLLAAWKNLEHAQQQLKLQ